MSFLIRLLVLTSCIFSLSQAVDKSSGRPFRWPSGVVPYSFGSNFDEAHAKLIIECLLEIEEATCLKFRFREYQQSFIEFVASGINHCTAEVIGHNLAGPNRILLGPGCFTKRALFHEILHVLGLDHEHQRPDRDKHITIHLENVATKHRKDFDIKQSMDAALLRETRYDYWSIMHYAKDAFAKKTGLVTIEVRNDASLTDLIGTAEEPSPGDYQKLSILYNCSKQEIASPGIKSTDKFGTYQAGIHKILLWPLGVIPYTFAANVTLQQRKALKEAIAGIEAGSCLKFVEGDFNEKPVSFVEFQLIENNSRLRSGVDSTGAVYGKKIFRLKTDSYQNERLINWWLLVSVGMVPETRRPDRDKYVSIDWDNVKRSDWVLLASFTELDQRLLELPYEVESLMHYRRNAYAKKHGLQTITSVTGVPSNRIGISTHPTRLDFHKVNALYNHCKPPGFTGEDEFEPYEEYDITVKPGKEKVVVVDHEHESEHPADSEGLSPGRIELVVFLCILAGVILFLMMLVTIARIKRKKSAGRRPSGESKGVPLNQQGDDDEEEMDVVVPHDRSNSDTAVPSQSRRFNYSYRRVAQDDYQEVQDRREESTHPEQAV